MKKLLYISCLLALVFFSCKKETIEVDRNLDYLPFQKGTYQIYDVIERSYLSNGSKIEKFYQLKTVIQDTFIDNSGRITREFGRYIRDTPQDDWVYSDLWTAYKSNTAFELVEENQRTVKLVFPITPKTTWDINAYNIEPKLTASYTDLFNGKTVNGLNFENTATVVQEDEFNLIMFRKKYEIYAKNVGLIKKHYQQYEISNFDTTNIRTGKDLYYTIVSFGIE